MNRIIFRNLKLIKDRTSDRYLFKSHFVLPTKHFSGIFNYISMDKIFE